MLRRLSLVMIATTIHGYAGTEPSSPRLTLATDWRPDRALIELATRAKTGVFAAVVLDPVSGAILAAVNPDRPMPMQSVVKAPLAAVVLARIDARTLRLDQRVRLRRSDLSAPRSPINDAFPGRDTYTVAELIEAAVGDSDNTAADVLLAMVGGPRAATIWLRRHGIRGIRIDRYEREFQPESMGLPNFRPEWAKESAYSAALATLPESKRAAATRAYLADARDTTTPRAAASFIAKLARGELLSPTSTELLLKVMTRTSTGARRLRAGLPSGATIAHKTGTGRTVTGVNQATNDIGLITLADKRKIVVASFLAGSTAPEAEREAVHASTARLAAMLSRAK